MELSDKLPTLNMIYEAADEKAAALLLLNIPLKEFTVQRLYGPNGMLDTLADRKFQHCQVYAENMNAATHLVRKPFRKTNAGRERIAADASVAAIPDYGHLSVAMAIAVAGQRLVLALWGEGANLNDVGGSE